MVSASVRSSDKCLADDIGSFVAAFPERELEVRRRWACDRRFRSLCADYEEASAALRRWSRAEAGESEKVQDYARLLEELGTEILALLNEFKPGPHRAE